MSELVENYLNELTKENAEKTASDRVSKIAGSVKLPENFDENFELRAYLEKKHL